LGKLELEYGGIGCKFRGLSPPAPTSVEQYHNIFS